MRRRTSLWTIIAAVFLLACGIASQVPDQVKTDHQIAQEAINCMMEKDPDSTMGVLLLGGKDEAARFIEQMGTREQIIEARDEVCTEEPTQESRQESS